MQNSIIMLERIFFFAYRISCYMCGCVRCSLRFRIHRLRLYLHLRFHFILFHLDEISFLFNAPFAISINDRLTCMHCAQDKRRNWAKHSTTSHIQSITYKCSSSGWAPSKSRMKSMSKRRLSWKKSLCVNTHTTTSHAMCWWCTRKKKNN